MPALKYFTLDLVLSDEQMTWPDHIEHDGVEEYAIDEAEVDRLLGDKAFSGGDVDAETIALIESQLEAGRYRLYFHGERARERAKNALSEAHALGLAATLIEQDEQDWNEKWRQGYSTVKVSQNLWIIPSWEREKVEVAPGVTALYLYPGQGFGTGRHETTALCLELFEQGSYAEQSVLDFGCGSGILGIAAQLRYNCQVDYLDIDASALENTRQNLDENHLDVADQHLILRKNFKPKKQYDLVFANILLDILIAEKEAIGASLKSQGKLIVSGLLNEHVPPFEAAYQEYKITQLVSRGDWSALELEFKK